MRLKVLSLAAAVALLAACTTAPEETGTTQGTGQQAGQATATTTAERLGPKPGTQEDLVVNVGDRVFFGFDKYNLTPEAQQTLQAQAAWLKKYPNVLVTIEGHADERGTREYNLGLGERRANAARDYLVALGVAPERIKTISYGKERPVALGHNEAAWQQNRRAVTVVTGRVGS